MKTKLEMELEITQEIVDAIAEKMIASGDYVPVVRCKDCAFHEFYENHHSCEWHGFADVKPDWFCADGERRDDG